MAEPGLKSPDFHPPSGTSPNCFQLKHPSSASPRRSLSHPVSFPSWHVTICNYRIGWLSPGLYCLLFQKVRPLKAWTWFVLFTLAHSWGTF